MSNTELSPSETLCAPSDVGGPEFQLLPPRDVPLGGVRGMTVTRLLPHRTMPTIGAWCFLDIAGPSQHPADILPHPHIGLQTVTWPISGGVRHRDTLGSDAQVRPGELNLMTSGRGIAHSEFSVRDGSPLHFLQLWIALPDDARHGPPRFQQYRDLPMINAPGLTGTLLIGTLAGLTSPAEVHTPLVGADLTIATGAEHDLALDPTFEHGVLVLEGSVTLDGSPLDTGPLAYLGIGRSHLDISSDTGARLLLLGGAPLREDLVMWWNFVARTHEEIVIARDDWEVHSSRFGEIPEHGDLRIPAPPMPAVRLTARRRPG